MKKKILAMLLCVAMILAGLPAYGATTVASGKFGAQGDNLTWTFDSNGTLTIGGKGEMESMVNGAPWSKYQSDIREVIISEGVTSVGNSAFYRYSSIKSVTVATSIAIIEDWAFSCECPEPIDVYYDGTEYEWHYNIDSDYGKNMFLFYGNLHLKDGSGDTIAEGECGPGLTWRLDGNSTLTVSGDGPMDDMDPDTDVHSPWYIGDLTPYIYRIVIEPGVTGIGSCAFMYCQMADSVSIPDTVSAIGDYAFDSCGKLTSVYIPDSVTDMGLDAFADCRDLAEVYLSNNLTELKYGSFIGTAIESLTLPDGLLSIGSSAFSHCMRLKTIVIPDEVQTIDSVAFASSGLESIYIPVSVTEISYDAFSQCSYLTDIYYGGSEEDWEKIKTNSENKVVFNGEMHYNVPQSEPSVEIKNLFVNQAGNIIVNVETKNLSSSIRLVAAAYSADGEMTAVGTVVDGQCILPADGAVSVKVFCWNGLRGLRPLHPVQTAEVNK